MLSLQGNSPSISSPNALSERTDSSSNEELTDDNDEEEDSEVETEVDEENKEEDNSE